MTTHRILMAGWALLYSGLVCLAQISPLTTPVMGPLFASGCGTADTVTVIDTFTTTSAASSFTRSSLNFGSNVAGRVIVNAVSWLTPGPMVDVSSTTMGGSSGTSAQDTGSAAGGGAVWYATPSGTTGQSVVTNFTGTVGSRFSAVVYSIITVGSTAPYGGNQATNTTSLSFNVNCGAWVLSAVDTVNAGTTISYNGIDAKTVDQTVGVSATSTQQHAATTEKVSRTLSPSAGMNLAVASWH